MKTVAIAKAAHYDEVNRRLETRDGERLIYKLARTRQRQSEDVETFHGVNDEHGQLSMDTKKLMERWRDYFEKISTGEFPHPPLPHAEPVPGPILPISAEEVVLTFVALSFHNRIMRVHLHAILRFIDSHSLLMW
ncbi:hypothetical protein Q1695_000939 [Nippostrongylus brasiliensis]|nr:hypothetical protein Q1695_000939 [Nippostrongylus brasiliensis]